MHRHESVSLAHLAPSHETWPTSPREVKAVKQLFPPLSERFSHMPRGLDFLRNFFKFFKKFENFKRPIRGASSNTKLRTKLRTQKFIKIESLSTPLLLTLVSQ